MNWKDRSNPAAGGAETFTEEIGERLVKLGHQVTIFASQFENGEAESYRSGIRIVRGGGKYTVYLKGRSYVKRHLEHFDIIIDEINTIPFRARSVAGSKPVLALIHQLAREIWFYETSFPINFLGYHAIEPLLLRGYRSIPTVTVSESTKEDLDRIGFLDVRIVCNGINIEPVGKVPQKEDHPVFAFVGRLVNCKLPVDAIEAFRKIRKSLPDAELWIVGDGYLYESLRSQNAPGVTFYGRVDDKTKHELLRRAHLLLAPSVREGWGISIIEANALGTPAVGYSVPGLRDSILDGKTGILVNPRSTDELARSAKDLIQDRSRLQMLSENAIEWSRNFSWDRSANLFNNILTSTIK